MPLFKVGKLKYYLITVTPINVYYKKGDTTMPRVLAPDYATLLFLTGDYKSKTFVRNLIKQKAVDVWWDENNACTENNVEHIEIEDYFGIFEGQVILVRGETRFIPAVIYFYHKDRPQNEIEEMEKGVSENIKTYCVDSRE